MIYCIIYYYINSYYHEPYLALGSFPPCYLPSSVLTKSQHGSSSSSDSNTHTHTHTHTQIGHMPQHWISSWYMSVLLLSFAYMYKSNTKIKFPRLDFCISFSILNNPKVNKHKMQTSSKPLSVWSIIAQPLCVMSWH